MPSTPLGPTLKAVFSVLFEIVPDDFVKTGAIDNSATLPNTLHTPKIGARYPL
jgi:hypothetical protein